MIYTLVPAYGRDYKSKKAVLADWNAGKDFKVVTVGNGGYINNAEAVKANIHEINIRYNHLLSIAVIKVNKNGEWK